MADPPGMGMPGFQPLGMGGSFSPEGSWGVTPELAPWLASEGIGLESACSSAFLWSHSAERSRSVLAIAHSIKKSGLQVVQ